MKDNSQPDPIPWKIRGTATESARVNIYVYMSFRV